MPQTTEIKAEIQGCLRVSENAAWEAFHKAEYQFLSLPRRLSEVLLEEINTLCEADTLPSLRVSGSLKELEEQLGRELSAYPALLADVLKLAERFAELSDTEELKMFFGFVRTDMCRRFHTDINTQRLLCTYAGSGTLWVPHHALNPETLDSGTNEEMLRSPEDVQQTREGEVLILKGALHPQSELGAAYHRSPSIVQEGEKRLLLRLDEGGFLS